MSQLPGISGSTAEVSADGRYRYTLGRAWGDGPALTFVMLNPSTADSETDDQTIRRCRSLARREGFGSLAVVNLWAYRATDPAALVAFALPFRDERNDQVVQAALSGAAEHGMPVVAAWGAVPSVLPADVVRRRIAQVCRWAAARDVQLWCFGTTANGSPRHPSRLPDDAPFHIWSDVAP